MLSTAINIDSDDDNDAPRKFMPKIPPSISLPSDNMPIAELLLQLLPPLSFDVSLVKAKKWFSTDHPQQITPTFLARPAPSLAQMEQLEGAFERQCRIGARSIVDNRFNDGRDRLPLWILTYWKRMALAIEGQKIWAGCDTWLDSESRGAETTQTSDKIRTLFQSIGWNTLLRCFDIPTSSLDLSTLLGQRSLSDSHLDMMLASVGFRARQDRALTTQVVVTNSIFSRALNDIAKQWDDISDSPSPRQAVVLRVESFVKDSGRRWVYYPGFVRSNHWIAVRLDFEERTIAYGDSLERSHLPSTFFNSLQAWLSSRFGGEFSLLGNTLAHGTQRDMYSCGICTVNAIAHAVLSDRLWTRARRNLERATWFATLIMNCRPALLAQENPPAESDSDESEPQNADHAMNIDVPVSNTDSNTDSSIKDVPINGPLSRTSVRSDHHPSPDLGAPSFLAHLLNPIRMPVDPVQAHYRSPPAFGSTHDLSSEGDERGGLSEHLSEFGGDLSEGGGGISACASVSELSDMEDIREGNKEGEASESLSELTGDLSGPGRYNISDTCPSASEFSALDDVPDVDELELTPPPKEKPRFFSIFEKSYKSKGNAASADAETHATSPVSKASSLRVSFKLKDKITTVKTAAKKRLSDVASVLRKRRRSSASEASEVMNPPPGKSSRKRLSAVPKARSRSPSPLGEAINLGAIGTSRSASASRANRKAARTDEFRPHATKWANWKRKLLAKDPDVEFFPNNAIDARHSFCGDVVKGKDIYDASRFIGHVLATGDKKCKPRHGVAVDTNEQSLLTDMWATATLGEGMQAISPKEKGKTGTLPCPGLTDRDDPRVSRYAERTGAEGGGARSIQVIAKEQFSMVWNELSEDEQKEVMDIQKHEHVWRIDHNERRVFSTECLHKVSQDHKTIDQCPRTLPCSNCDVLLNNSRFRAILSKKTPDDKNYKFTNYQYRPGILASIYARVIEVKDIIESADARNSPAVKYAKGVLEGKYKGHEVFTGLVEAMVSKLDREERGVGMQNFRYSPAYDEFIQIVRIQSPEVHRFLSEHLAARTERSYREREARQPKFPMKICEQTFSFITEQLKSLDYDGPIALSCDDTKLFPAWRIYWDSIEQGVFLVGAAGEPLRVADPENLKKTISDARAMKATKVRLWCLQIPLPKVAPIILAAIPIESTMTASDLLELVEPLINGLLARKIRLVSYACDGTESERSLQRLLLDRSSGRINYTIPNFFDDSSPFKIIVPTFDSYPIIMIQDSKHALKTFRNNLFSGARLLVLGNYVAIYDHIRKMAMEDNSPLYHRDVEKLDRQDDNAATRLFSAATLAYLGEHHPEYLGEIVYLFVFGELVDAYQNRQISHLERIKMALRAKYFLDMWRIYLQRAGYKESQHFLSREASDIAGILIHGLLALVLIHRDHLPDAFPLLPWLHSSESCEHVFGEARRIVKDFTMLDFMHMVPKLRVKLKEAAFRATVSNPKARASGYNHTYFDAKGMDLHDLASFPDDAEISRMSQEACDEAEALISLLGIQPAYLKSPLGGATVIGLPSIISWYGSADEGAEEGAEDVDDDDVEEDPIGDAQELQDLIDAEEANQLGSGFTRQEDEALTRLKFAALAVAADDFMQIQQLPEDEDLPELHDQQRDEIRGMMSSLLANSATTSQPVLPSLNLPDEPTLPFGLGHLTTEDLDFSLLVTIRRRHQTRQAATGVRSKQDSGFEGSDKVAELTLRQQLIRQFYEIIKTQQERGIGTGFERAARWIVNEHQAGNVANARLASDINASKIATKRKKVFTQASVPALEHVVAARVSSLRPLRLGDYGIIFTETGLMVGHVIALYSKSNGRYGRHCSVDEAGNVAALSYIAVQAFQHIRAHQFSSITATTAAWQTKHFVLVPSTCFLCLIPPSVGPTVITPMGFELHEESTRLFRTLNNGFSKFAAAMKQFRSRKQIPSDADAD